MMDTPVEGFKIRFATKEDVGLILEFIKDLAMYEKLASEVVATEQDLLETLFDKAPSNEPRGAQVILGYLNDKPISFALFFHNYSTFLGRYGLYLEDLFVKEEGRGRGIGKTMLAYLAHLAKQRNCHRLEWVVLDWNDPAIKFYQSLGAKMKHEWKINRLIGPQLDALAATFKTA